MTARSSVIRTGGYVVVLCVMALAMGTVSVPAAAQRGGPQPWTGPMGITESVAAITARTAPQTPPGDSLEPKPVLRADRTQLRPNPLATNVINPPTTSSPDDSGGPHLPQTPSLSFTGASFTDDNIRLFPPDSMGAVGPSQFIMAINGWIRSFGKASGTPDQRLNISDAQFFSTVSNGARPADPRIRYDRFSGRWFVIMITVAIPNRIMIAVSDSGTITSGSNFTFFFIDVAAITPPINSTNPCLADYPTLGIDSQALYIGVNNFCGPNLNNAPFHSTDGYVIRKSSILGPGPLVATVFRGLMPSPEEDGLYTPQGVDNFDAPATEGYFIGTSGLFFGKLLLRRVSDPAGSPTISANIPINVNPTNLPIKVPHAGNTGGDAGRLDALDDRLYAAVMRNGRIWTAHNIQVDRLGVAGDTGGRNGMRWYELQGIVSPGSPTAAQQGTIFDPTTTNPRSYWMGTVMVSGQGHMAAGFSQAGNSDRADAAAAGRLAADTPNTTRAVTAYTSTTANYNPPGNPGGSRGRRWGDYSYTSLDPEDDMTMWTIQEFTDQTNSWGVRVAKLLAPPPVTPNTVTPSSVLTGQAAVSVTLTGQATNGAGFFDPGAGFAKRLSVSVSGGVTVNSVTVVSPTTLTLSLNTTNATPGTKSVTVSNPDGQSATGTGVLTVTSAAGPDFGLSCTPAAVSVARGGAATTVCTATSQNGFAGAVQLSCPTPPTGIFCVFAPAAPMLPAGGGAPSLLRITATGAATAGPTALVVRGISGALSHDFSVNLTVTPGTPGDVNGDGELTIVDALCVARDVAGLPATAACPLPLVNPDVNTDDEVSIVDALCIARAVAGLAATPACPHPLGLPVSPPPSLTAGGSSSP